MERNSTPGLAQRIDALLPQTQCRRCGYEGCRPYADAVAAGMASINRCPPGGDATVAALAALLDTPLLALDPARGEPRPWTIAFIDEAACIGCTLCIAACPVDAIVGAAKLAHTVIADRCTGCELCLPPCPVDCIELRSANRPWTRGDADRARGRYVAHRTRLDGDAAAKRTAGGRDDEALQRRSVVAAALARARARRAAKAAPRS
jgi:H+/Na+-translocating ferredoxin:NAD+ oxidoreductase subunit B